MRILICGDREWNNKKSIYDYVKTLPKDTVIIEGEANGADKLSRICGEELGLEVLKFPAKWEIYGKAAGPIRNQQMLDEGRPEKVVAFHHDLSKSRGTKDMVERARRKGILTEIITK